jgi:sugar transferase EpsL
MLKRLFDFTATATGLILLSPALLFLYFLVRHRMGDPVFFRQQRPGLDGKPFYMYNIDYGTDCYAGKYFMKTGGEYGSF